MKTEFDQLLAEPTPTLAILVELIHSFTFNSLDAIALDAATLLTVPLPHIRDI